MKKKELKSLAVQIARAERTLQTSSDTQEIANAQSEILRLSKRVTSLEDLMLIDDLIQKELKNF
jgi:hypothetical protein